MHDIPQIEVEIMFLSKAQGGREQPPVLTEPIRYRPHLAVGKGERLGVTFLTAPEDIRANVPFTAILALVHYPNVNYASLVPEAEFTIHEGSRIVGRGRVLKR